MQRVQEVINISSKKIESNVLNRLFYSTLALALVSPQFSLLGYCPTDPWWASTLIQKLQGYLCRSYLLQVGHLTYLALTFPQGALAKALCMLALFL